MMTDISTISMLELQVLWHLSQHPAHGYALIQDLSKHRSTPLTPGTLYPLLARFEKNELIRVSETGDRDKKVYMLTETGQKILDKLAHEFTETFDGIYVKYHCSACTHFLQDKERALIPPSHSPAEEH